ncbi:MAG: M64 family metallo-endopeptidase [Pseudomonadales bacterium]|nr:M64 family metallo-endopeptidase [Pseudomonadales bacterium]
MKVGRFIQLIHPMRAGLVATALIASQGLPAIADEQKQVSQQAPTKASATAIRSARQTSQFLPQSNVIYYDAIEDGEIVGGGMIEVDTANPMLAPSTLQPSAAPAPYNSQTILNNGSVDNRIDIVLVGDGYTSSEIASYANHANNLVNGFFNEGVLLNYKSYFNVHRVDVTSNESGVDHDPQGTLRDTALDMRYYCSNIARLLCINVSKARDAASNAPQTDQILALANSTTYGGAGYPSSDLGTVAGNNGSALEVAIHEFGHSFADLADEYTYGGSETYTGPELTPVNVSIYQKADMQQRQTKWHRWFDVSGVDTFEGGNYSVYGVYRPTNNSKMRSLGQPFGPINDEQMIIKIYQTVSPIDASTPEGSINRGNFLSVTPLQPLNHDLTIQWWVDGQLSSENGTTFNTGALSAGNHTVAVRVMDETDQVRDETARSQYLTAERVWNVVDNGGVLTADLSLKLKSNDFLGWATPFQFWKNGSNGTISLSANISNNGPDTAQDIRFAQSIPAAASWQSFESTLANCFVENQQVICEINSLNSGQSVAIDLTYTTQSQEKINFTANVSSSLQDSDASNNETSGNYGGSLGILFILGSLLLATRRSAI